MSYRIAFIDRTEVIVDDKVGEKLKDSMLSKDMPTHITLAGNIFKTNQITSVTKSNFAEQTISERPALPAPKYNCVAAGTSIQYLIHQVAMKDKQNWPKLVRDKAWRERTRQAILTKYPKRKFCDHRAGTHACLDKELTK